MSMEREIDALGWRWPSACPTTLVSELEKRLHSPPPTARRFYDIRWAPWVPEAYSGEESWVSVAGMHRGGGGTGFPAGHHDHYWLPCVRRAQIVRNFVSAFLHGAGRPDLWGQVARDWLLMEQGQFDTWTSSDMVPNGLALEVDLTQEREGEVNPGQWTLYHGGRLSSRRTVQARGNPPAFRHTKAGSRRLRTGISLHFSNVVWVGLLPGTGEDREINPFDAKSPKETALELTEATSSPTSPA